MKAIKNNSLFGPLAYEFALRYVKRIANTLHYSRYTPFNAVNTTIHDRIILLELCINGIKALEEQFDYQRPEAMYRPRPAFEYTSTSNTTSIIVGEIILNDILDEYLIKQALNEIKSEILNNISAIDTKH